MKPLLLVSGPLAGALLAAIWPSNRTRPWLLPVVGVAHAGLCCWLLLKPPVVAADAWLGFDPLARAVLPACKTVLLVALANPGESGRVPAVLSLEPDLRVLGPLGAYMVGELGTVVSMVLLSVTLAVWAIAPLAIATRVLSAQDA